MLNQQLIRENEGSDERLRRPRSINSCDHCRRRKLRCTRAPGEDTCNACIAVNALCTFSDRDRQQATRERRYADSIAPGGSPSDSSAEEAAGPSALTPLGREGVVMASFQYDPATGDAGPIAPPTYTALSPRDRQEQMIPGARASVAGLFDPAHLDQPSPVFMPVLISTFFTHVSPTIPILVCEQVIGDFLLSSLPSSLANIIAAMAVPYTQSSIPAFASTDLESVARSYLFQAELALADTSTTSSLETLQALVLMAHAYSHVNETKARAVAQQAVQIALGLNIQDPTVIQRLGSTPEEHVCLTVLAARVNELYRSLMAGGSSA